MGSFFPALENYNLEEQLKILEEDELLDFWEESQFMDSFLENGHRTIPSFPAMNYERLILQELQIRACIKPIKPHPLPF